MLRNRTQRAWLHVFVLLVPLLLAGCGKTVADTADDATITARVKTALLNETKVGALEIDVDTAQGVVTMSGSVKSKAEKARAIEMTFTFDF